MISRTTLDWRSTDAQEKSKRQLRARQESFQIRCLEPEFPFHGSYAVLSPSGMTYTVEVRDPANAIAACNCADFRTNGLGLCKHTEAVLQSLKPSKSGFPESPRIDLVCNSSRNTLHIERGLRLLPKKLRALFDENGTLIDAFPDLILESLKLNPPPGFRISLEAQEWSESRKRSLERAKLRREYEQSIQSGKAPASETLMPLYPYQREGMLHLAFTERALLADDIGLGKTPQAIAAAVLLHRLGAIKKVFIITPASLKAEWAEQIQRFSSLPFQMLEGSKNIRLRQAASPSFFTLAHYEQITQDLSLINQTLQPDLIILDEAQRIRNWNTQIAQSVKRLQSRYAFVLTNAPMESRLDDLYSLIDFVDPKILGPLFRFNREYYQLDAKGRPVGHKNLAQLRDRLAPWVLRRKREDLALQLPTKTERHHLVRLHPQVRQRYNQLNEIAQRLSASAVQKPLSETEEKRLMKTIAQMRLLCATPERMDPALPPSPKLAEIEHLIREFLEIPTSKIIIFSEWEFVLENVRRICDQLKAQVAWYTGSTPLNQRRQAIELFRQSSDCRIFLSTDVGRSGLNLHHANIVIHCDIPWNASRLSQRVGRAWRPDQLHPVTVIHIATENSIEQRLLHNALQGGDLSDGFFDPQSDLHKFSIPSSRVRFIQRVRQMVGETSDLSSNSTFKSCVAAKLGPALVRYEEKQLDHHLRMALVVVTQDAEHWKQRLQRLLREVAQANSSESNLTLEVIDTATDQALRRLTSIGWMSKDL